MGLAGVSSWFKTCSQMIWAWMLLMLLEKEKLYFTTRKNINWEFCLILKYRYLWPPCSVLRYNQGYYVYILLVLWYLQLWPESKQCHNGPYMIWDVSFQPYFFYQFSRLIKFTFLNQISNYKVQGDVSITQVCQPIQRTKHFLDWPRCGMLISHHQRMKGSMSRQMHVRWWC